MFYESERGVSAARGKVDYNGDVYVFKKKCFIRVRGVVVRWRQR